MTWRNLTNRTVLWAALPLIVACGVLVGEAAPAWGQGQSQSGGNAAQPGRKDEQLSDALRKVLEEVKAKLGTDGEATVAISDYISALAKSDQTQLREIAGEDGALSLREIEEALEEEDGKGGGKDDPDEDPDDDAGAPSATGKVSQIDLDQQVLLVEDADGQVWTVSIGSQTAFVLVEGTGPSVVPGVGQGGSSGRVRERKAQSSDLAVQMQVEVFGSPTEPSAVEATRVRILYGGAIQEPFRLEAVVAFYDPWDRWLDFQIRPPIQAHPDAQITGAGGQAMTFGEFGDYFGERRTLSERRLLVDLEPTQDPNRQETRAIRILAGDEEAPALSEGQILVELHDPFRIQLRKESDLTIEPGPLPEVKVTRDARIVRADGSEGDSDDLVPGIRVEAVGDLVSEKGKDVTYLAEVVTILSGEPFQDEGRVVSVAADGTIALAGPAPVPIDARAQFRDVRGKRVSLQAFQQLLEEGAGLRILAEYNRFGHGIVRLEVHKPKQPKPIREYERIYQASEVSLADEDGRSVLVIAAPDAILVPEGTPIIGDGADLAGLEGERVIVEGELIGETRTARSVLVLASIDGIDLQVEVGDFDGEGIENDISVGIYDQADAELVVPVRVALDRLPPEEATSGQVMYNLTPGKHTVSVDVPSAPGLSAEEKVIIRARESKLQVVSTTPQD